MVMGAAGGALPAKECEIEPFDEGSCNGAGGGEEQGEDEVNELK